MLNLSLIIHIDGASLIDFVLKLLLFSYRTRSVKIKKKNMCA